LPSASRVTRFSGRGRSSVDSQKSIACSATSFSERPNGASLVIRGFSPRYMSDTDLPTIWMLPIGNSHASLAK